MIKRFTLTLDPILIVLVKFTIFRQNSTFKCGGPGPLRNKSGDLGLCAPPPIPPPMAVTVLLHYLPRCLR